MPGIEIAQSGTESKTCPSDFGKSNPNATNKQIMTKVMKQYQSKGLYVLKQVAENKWVPVLDKISGQQLQHAIQIIQSKNENGLNK